eukprot:TRINITY_DN28096_c0_g2_i2.p2 TRINITY_DN28096_c0_g2~~TRINITY_DN28096_c0_g2_i2.p2  ORF type:complete len:332 (-),score=40.09 TRINITY_DN28096_c0_g2_i2:185-1180(-)
MGLTLSRLRSTHEEDTEETYFSLTNNSLQSVSLYWIDFNGKYKLYDQLQPGQTTSQHTYSTHVWAVTQHKNKRKLIGAYVGISMKLTATKDQNLQIQPLQNQNIEIQEGWGCWTQRGISMGIPIMAYDCVSQPAVLKAEKIIQGMLKNCQQSLINKLIENNAEIGIIGCKQKTTDIPPHQKFKNDSRCDSAVSLDEGTRGLGGTLSCPTTSVGEENLLESEDDKYNQESILVHEFAHTIMNCGMDIKKQKKVRKWYKKARKSKKYELNSYIMLNEDEYWAECCQIWFSATKRKDDATGGILSKQDLQNKDKNISILLQEVFGEADWKYWQL